MTDHHARKTALHDRHVSLGARMVPFAGFQMPLQYAGQLAEHRAVRGRLGMFDLSHMGEFRLRGPGALEAADRLVTNRVAGIPVGQAVYSPMCRPGGGIVDDLLVYRLEDSVLLVVNASNIDKDRDWILENLPGDVAFEDESDATALIALQGPGAEAFTAEATSIPVTDLAAYRAVPAEVAGVPVLLSRTGYTGEDGFELYVAAGRAGELWDRLLDPGRGSPPVPVGLAARDTLRFEMGYCLYGNDIDETTTPLEAGLGWTVKLDKDDFLGKGALAAQKEAGVTRRLVGLATVGDRAVPRAGYAVHCDDAPAGRVTSGTFAPSLERGMALAYVPVSHARKGTRVGIAIRNRIVAADVVRPPFYTGGSRKTN
jgi:aminomethyltransferase